MKDARPGEICPQVWLNRGWRIREAWHLVAEIPARSVDSPRLGRASALSQNGVGGRMRTTSGGLWWRLPVWLAFSLLVVGPVVCVAGTTSVSPTGTPQIRLGFTTGVIGDINHSDARASMIAWGQALLEQRHVVAETVPNIFERPEDLFRALQDGQVDGVALMTNEFLAHPAMWEADAVYLTSKNGKITTQYVLLVHQGSGISDLGGLKGRNIELYESAATSLASAWLDTCLSDYGLGLPETVFRRIDRREKVSKTVLRVFFRQVDACVVTREAFETMSELNPQLGKELRVLATSAEVVPSIFFMWSGFTGHLRDEVEASIAALQESVAGRQALTVFQGDALVISPLSCLNSARDLLAAAALVRGKPARIAADKTLLGTTR